MEHPSPLVESTEVLLRICSYLFIVQKHQTHINNCFEISLRIFLHSGFVNYRKKELLCVDQMCRSEQEFFTWLGLAWVKLENR